MNLPYYTKLTTAFAIPAGIPQRTTGALVNLPYYTRLSTAFAIPAGTPRRTAGALVNFPYYTTLTAAPRRATGALVNLPYYTKLTAAFAIVFGQWSKLFEHLPCHGRLLLPVIHLAFKQFCPLNKRDCKNS